MNNLPQHKCGPAPVAVGKYLWLTVLGFGGGAAGVAMLIGNWLAIPELLNIFVTMFIAVCVTLILMRYLTPTDTRKNLQGQFAIFSNKHNWVMTWLYTMTFGSFIGYASAFPILIDVVFGQVAVDPEGAQLAAPDCQPQRTRHGQLHLDRCGGRRLDSTRRGLAIGQGGWCARYAVGYLGDGGRDDPGRRVSCIRHACRPLPKSSLCRFS